MRKMFLFIFLIILILSACNNKNSKANSGIKNQVEKLDLSYTYDLLDIAMNSKGNFYIADKERIGMF